MYQPMRVERLMQERRFWKAAVVLGVILLVTAEVSEGSVLSQIDDQLPEYQIGPGDVLAIHVFGLDQLDQDVIVANSGKIHVARVGVVNVFGLTGTQVENEIARVLKDENLVNDPWVRVRVIEYRSQPVYVVGAVNSPGQFVLSGETHLLDVVSRAGGFSPRAASDGFLLRRRYRPRVGVSFLFETAENYQARARVLSKPDDLGGESGQFDTQDDDLSPGETVKINLKELKEGTRPELNVSLQGGDVFFVPQRVPQFIYIVGDVLLPGAYGLPDEYDHLTVARVISYAGGPLRTAKLSDCFIMRRGEDGEVQTVAFDFAEIIDGKDPDFSIEPDDIIFVPRSVGKTVGYSLLDMAAMLAWRYALLF